MKYSRIYKVLYRNIHMKRLILYVIYIPSIVSYFNRKPLNDYIRFNYYV